ncbi:MAG: toll/interleukin-1 receptor domain-containing protein [Pasteurella sp.]|nr:toll/interleukin-1 receptor domain-containing protein [Pasteurella sp.]
MLFFCFSSKDRHTIVESILYHISNYAIPLWYDRQQMLLGDQRDYKNFEEGVGKSDYALIILSKNSIASICAREEIDLIENKYNNGLMTVFPIFYNLIAKDVPPELQWMTELVYKELDDTIDTIGTCNHIICRILLDELNKYQIRSIDQFINRFNNISAYSYLVTLLKSYNTISEKNISARITIIFSACKYIMCNYNIDGIPKFYFQGVQFLFNHTKLNLPVDLRETLIFERLLLLLLNYSIFGNLI